jgi:hypothetical protein
MLALILSKARQNTRFETYQSHIGLARGGQRCKPRLVGFHPAMHTLIRSCRVVLIDFALEDQICVEWSGSLCVADRLCLRQVSMKGTMVRALL